MQNSKFSEFIRNASDEEKQAVYMNVIDEANKKQRLDTIRSMLNNRAEILHGTHKGKICAITWYSPEENLIRVTPLEGDPMCSIQTTLDSVKVIPCQVPKPI